MGGWEAQTGEGSEVGLGMWGGVEETDAWAER